MIHPRLQHGDGGVLLPGSRLQSGHPTPEGLGLHIVLLHLLHAGLCGGIHLIQRRLRPLLVLTGGLVIRLQLPGLDLQGLKIFQPHADLQHPQLVPQHQILLRCLRLLPQGLHLQLQLSDLVVDADQILLRPLELALRLLLAVAVLADARRLLEHLTALTAFDGQDLVDLALSDDGVALPAHAGVHKQLVDILETHGLAVDVIFRLPAAVVAASDGHLRLVPAGEDVLRVVDDQRHLCKAHLAALLRAAEDHVLHLGSPQLAAVLLAHDPADGVGDIGLAGAVWPHDGRDVLTEVQHRLIREALEALDFQSPKVHESLTSFMFAYNN